MSEEKQVVKESSSSNAEVAIDTVDNKPSKSSFFNAVVGLISITAIAAVGIGGYLGFQQLQLMSGRIVFLEENEKSVRSQAKLTADAMAFSFSQMQTELQQVMSQQKDLNQKQIDEISEQLLSTRRQLQTVGGRHQSDWLLAEADYLVRIASNRLMLERDHVTALILLVNADERLMQIDDPGLQPIREALSRDMATLRLVKRADIAGLAIRISSLIPQLKSLPLIAFQLPEETITEIEATIAKDISWQQSLKNTLKELSVKWFDVRDHGRPVTPLMAPETEAILLTNMSLLLQTTQFATLRQHSELYHHSLSQLKDWTTEYFDTKDQVVIAFINEIDLLNGTSVTTELPKSLESRLLLAREVEAVLNQLTVSSAISDQSQSAETGDPQ